jgi:hypothetical protein
MRIRMSEPGPERGSGLDVVPSPDVVPRPDVGPEPPPATVPVWLLDVDGVLNASSPGWSAPHDEGAATFEGVDFPMRWAPGLVSAIRRLHRTSTVEVRWATTWVDEIDAIERLMRLPALPTAFSTRGLPPTVRMTQAKQQAALTVVEVEQRPLIWTDDDAIPSGGTVLRRLRRSGQPALLVVPDSRRGLLPEHVASIEEFLRDPWA